MVDEGGQVFKDFLSTHAVLGDRVRLAILATLAAADEPMDFNTVRETLDLTKGNLSSHIRKLEDAKLVKVHKEFVERKPRTTYTCTARGRKELGHYLRNLEDLLRGATK
ncbi:MAG: transcriptional regulator [Deltaproteobacteria bacterium]|nr:transcriptional regulator [Deltaproteobacteria bacterium]